MSVAPAFNFISSTRKKTQNEHAGLLSRVKLQLIRQLVDSSAQKKIQQSFRHVSDLNHLFKPEKSSYVISKQSSSFLLLLLLSCTPSKHSSALKTSHVRLVYNNWPLSQFPLFRIRTKINNRKRKKKLKKTMGHDL